MIYLDNAATTKPYRNCIEKASIFHSNFFNPSALYKDGILCAKEISDAKKYILRTLGTSKHEVIFTSCGTESDNMAVFGVAKRGVFVTDKGEHAAVHQSMTELKNRGISVEFIDILPDGRIDEDKLYSFVNSNNVGFVSIMHVNNETGAINDINKIAANIKKLNPRIIFHADGVQAYGKLPYVMSEDIDLYSVSAHKINALKGVGALIKRKGLHVSPLIYGGGQENGLRSGTENVFGIKCFEYAASEHFSNLQNNFDKVKTLKQYCVDSIDEKLFTVISGEASSPYILSVSAKGLKGEVITHLLEEKGILVGNGSACSSKSPFSRVISACGYNEEILGGVIRISFCAENTVEEIKTFVTTLNSVTLKLKGIINNG